MSLFCEWLGVCSAQFRLGFRRSTEHGLFSHIPYAYTLLVYADSCFLDSFSNCAAIPAEEDEEEREREQKKLRCCCKDIIFIVYHGKWWQHKMVMTVKAFSHGLTERYWKKTPSIWHIEHSLSHCRWIYNYNMRQYNTQCTWCKWAAYGICTDIK